MDKNAKNIIINQINKYIDFRNNLVESVKYLMEFSSECYLINEDWKKELEERIKLIRKTSNENLNYLFSIKKKPIFINSFSQALIYLKNNINFKLVNKELIEFLYNNNNILKNNNVLYVLGKNNKLIIDFMDKNDNKSILIEYPFNSNPLNENAYIISKDKKLYKKLLSELGPIKYEKHIIPFKEYIKTLPLDDNGESDDNRDNFEICIIKVFIYLFYYEKYLLNKKGNIFNEREMYYLINPDWLEEYKQFYNYQKNENILQYINKDNPKIKYKNLEDYLESIINKCLNNFNSDISNGLPNDLKNINNIDPLCNISTFKKGFIIPSKIFNIIRKSEGIKICYKQIKIINEEIYLYFPYKIVIGNLKNIFFIPKYILNYNLLEIYNLEKDLLFNSSFENYKTLKNLVDNTPNIQIIKDKNGEEIGNLHVLSDEG